MALRSIEETSCPAHANLIWNTLLTDDYVSLLVEPTLARPVRLPVIGAAEASPRPNQPPKRKGRENSIHAGSRPS